MTMNMAIIMTMNIYITPQNQEYLSHLKVKGESMSGLINRLLTDHFGTIEQFEDIIPGKQPSLEKVLESHPDRPPQKKTAEATPRELPDAEDIKASNLEQDCCKNDFRPCKHWTFDGDRGGYVNMFSGRFREAD